MHVAQEETHIRPFGQLKEVSKCHLRGMVVVDRNMCLHKVREDWEGLDLLE